MTKTMLAYKWFTLTGSFIGGGTLTRAGSSSFEMIRRFAEDLTRNKVGNPRILGWIEGPEFLPEARSDVLYPAVRVS